MDSTLALALMMKSKIIFERDSNFLSFPLTPIAYTPDQLSFLLDATMTPADLTALSSFSSLVNMIPDGATWPAADVRYLDDAYGDILRNADLATSTRTPDEEKQYQDALAVLYTLTSDGLRTPSPQLIAYQQYRDAVIVAQQNYANGKSTADASTDPAVQAQWATQGPALQQAITDATNDWIEKGYKADVEEARGVEQRLGAKSPETQWAAWTTQFDPHIAALTDTAGESFYPSVPSPSSVFESGAVWQQFTLLGDEADALIRQAPPDLRARFSDAQDAGVSKVTFEYTSLLIKRAWFDPSVFTERFWRFGDASHLVSDGESRSSGTCPAYVMAVVFVRNIQVELEPAPNLQPGSNVNLGFLRLQALQAQPAKPLILTPVRPLAPAAFETHAIAAPAALRTVRAEPMAAIAVASPPKASVTLAQARLFTRVPFPPIRPPVPPSPPPPSAPAVDTSMYVLGFICRPVPQSPNPDPTLTWS